jgi:hypothetical protein
MADNSTRLDAGSVVEQIASDDISGVKFQRVKVTGGSDGTASDIGTDSVTGDGASGAGGATALVVAPRQLVYNGSTWDRQRAANALGDLTAGQGELAVTTRLYNGSTFFHQRGNEEAALLVSAARTATTTTATQVAHNARGAIFTISVTSAGTGTLQLAIYSGVTAFQLALYPTISASPLHGLYPGVVDADLSGNWKAGVLPRSWTASVIKSDSSSWTYSLYHYLII